MVGGDFDFHAVAQLQTIDGFDAAVDPVGDAAQGRPPILINTLNHHFGQRAGFIQPATPPAACIHQH